MKKLLSVIALLMSTGVFSQAVPSSCNSTDSIKKLYKTDAERMSVRSVHKTNDNYKDTIKPKKTLTQRYLNALLAVYNATAIPERSVVINDFNIHTDKNPPMNALNVKASSTASWMQELYANTSPTSNPFINNLINTYSLQYTYIQSTLYDVVVFTCDSNLNIKAMAKVFTVQPGVISAEPEGIFNDEKNIKDSVNLNFLLLEYSIGWGTCYDTCDMRHSWTFKVYNDCSVEFMGQAGAPIFLGVQEQTLNPRIKLFPNPCSGSLNVELADSDETVLAQIFSVQGDLVLTERIDGQNRSFDVSALSPGIYLFKANVAGVNICRKVIIE